MLLFKNPRVYHENIISLKNPHKLLSEKTHYLPNPTPLLHAPLTPTRSLPSISFLRLKYPLVLSKQNTFLSFSTLPLLPFPRRSFSTFPTSRRFPLELSVPFILLHLLLHLSTPFPARDKMNFISVES